MKVQLTQGAYTSRSLSASAQRCVNLYPEIDPSDSEFPVSHYPTPGLTLLANCPGPGVARCEFTASNGALYRVIGTNVYYVDSGWNHHLLGAIASGTTPCSMADNGLVVVLVDGTTAGYAIDLATQRFAAITSPAFLGADKVDYVDTYFVFNQPGTGSIYLSIQLPAFADLTTAGVLAGTITGGSGYTNGTYTNVALTQGSGSGAVATITVSGGAVTAVSITIPGIDYANTDVLSANSASIGGGSGFLWTLITAGAFNSLDIASPSGAAGNVISVAVAHRNIWIMKANSTEIWSNTGAADFPFEEAPGAYVEHGCAAKYSVAVNDGSVFWIAKDKAGTAIVVRGEGYAAKRISTHCVENIISQITLSDAVGFCYQQGGHTFYQLTFPTGNQTWVYDIATDLWHERVWTDTNGQENRHRAQLGTFAYSTNVVGDWQTGALYSYDLNNYTDNGSPIVRRRGFPHMASDGDRVFFRQFIADMEVGNYAGGKSSAEPLCFLRWSDSRGYDWGQPISEGMGATGQYKRSVQFQRLGMGRDRVFELFWSAPVPTCLNGAYIDVSKAAT